MKYGITGAGGQLGGLLVKHALARTAASNLVAITRNPAKLESIAKQGVEVRAGDFNQPAGLPAAFHGIDRLVMIPTGDLAPGVRIGQQTAAIDAAKQAGVGHLIYISTVSPRPDAANVLLDSHFATEQRLIGSGLNWTLLRMSVYMDSLVDAARRAVASGTYSAVSGAPAAYVTREDLAKAAAGLLVSPGHVGITYHATGPVSVGQKEIAQILSKVSGKAIAFANMTEDQQKQGLEAIGMPPFLVTGILGFQAALRAGAFDLVTGDVARLSGTPAQGPEEFLANALRGS